MPRQPVSFLRANSHIHRAAHNRRRQYQNNSAFLANLDVPPGLTDTSLKRISTRYLLWREVIDESEKFHVSAVLLWTGRLSRMPEVVAWVISQFPQHQNFGNGRDLYVRTIPSKTDRR